VLRPGGVLIIRIPNGECFRWAVTRMRTLPWPLTNWLRATLAWNNLLAFPYLYGYSVRTVDRLLRSYGFTPVAVHGDTLMQLGDQQTKTWALVEESMLKSFCRFTAMIEKCFPPSQMKLVPWLDVYYQLALPSETADQSYLNISPVCAVPRSA